MIIGLGYNDVAAMDAGSLLVITWHERDGGMHFAPARFEGVRKGKLHVTSRPFGESAKKLLLIEYSDYSFMDGRRQEFALKIPTAKELDYCCRTFGQDIPVPEDEDDEDSQPMTAKEIAVALLAVVTSKPKSSRKLCELAGVDYDEYATVVPLVLKKLDSLGRITATTVEKEDGRRVKRWSVL